jgi:universal stress protein A
MTGERILCAVDFSDGARAALRLAAELARTRNAELVLLHVEEPPLWQREPAVHLPGDVRAEQRAQARSELESWRRVALELGVPAVTTTLASGVAWDRIVALANDDAAIELVIVGTHGRSGIARALIGSVAERVVRHAPCSVLVAR